MTRPYKQDNPPETIRRLMRARHVLAGLDENGVPSHAGQMDADVISFADGEGNRRPHPHVISQAVGSLLDTEISSLEKYFFGRRFQEFEDKITEMFMQEGIAESIAQNICISSGTVELFNAFLHSVSEAGSIFLTAVGYYHSLANWCDIQNVQLEVVQTSKLNDYKLTRMDLEAWMENWWQLGQRRLPSGVILFNPTYTGAVYTSEELAELADFLDDHDMVALEDSIFMYTRFDPKTEIVHLANFEPMKERSVTLNGGSKAYNLANMRIGWACGTQWIIDKMKHYIGAIQGTVPHISKVMALAALNAPPTYLEGNRQEFRLRAQLVRDLVQQANQELISELGDRLPTPFLEMEFFPQAGHSMLVSFQGLQGLMTAKGQVIKDSIDITRFFLQAAKVCLSPGLSIGFNDCQARISFACVGLPHTYPDVRQAEIGAVLEEIWRRTSTDLTFGQLLQYLGPSFQGKMSQYSDRYNAGFEMGRTQIREGILSRMVPAILGLVKHNRKIAMVTNGDMA